MAINGKGRSFVDLFVEQTVETASPPIFRKWAAISAVAGALEGKVWLETRGIHLFPNLYVILVGPPGVGKSLILNRINYLYTFLQDHYKGSSSLTRASFIDELYAAKKMVLGTTYFGVPGESFNALTAAIAELGTLLPTYESDFLSVLTDIYDCTAYKEKRRTRDLEIEIDRPYFNIVSATTPSWLGKFMPEGAWDQGFISRNIMIYCGVTERRSPFEKTTKMELLDLAKDLKLIAGLKGKFDFSEEAIRAFDDWFFRDCPPTPDHPRLASYLPRRPAHLLKLCVLAAIAGGASKVVEIEHYQIALGWLLEAETFMPDIFRAMTKGGDSQAFTETYHEILKRWGHTKKPVPEALIRLFLMERTPTHNIDRMLEMLVRTEHVKVELTPSGHRVYTPLPKPPGF